MSEAKQKQLDRALDMTFPASDPPASHGATGTEPPRRPAGREAPAISRDAINKAARRSRRRRADERHRGLGREGVEPTADRDTSDPHAGLGREGED